LASGISMFYQTPTQKEDEQEQNKYHG